MPLYRLPPAPYPAPPTVPATCIIPVDDYYNGDGPRTQPQLLKEHLQGEGQWLTRYGDCPDPTPGAGAGVIGGDRDGDVGFMGVEAMTRYRLPYCCCCKLLSRGTPTCLTAWQSP